MTRSRDLYDVLVVKRDATRGEIRSGFKKAAKKAHPDAASRPARFTP